MLNTLSKRLLTSSLVSLLVLGFLTACQPEVAQPTVPAMESASSLATAPQSALVAGRLMQEDQPPGGRLEIPASTASAPRVTRHDDSALCQNDADPEGVRPKVLPAAPSDSLRVAPHLKAGLKVRDDGLTQVLMPQRPDASTLQAQARYLASAAELAGQYEGLELEGRQAALKAQLLDAR